MHKAFWFCMNTFYLKLNFGWKIKIINKEEYTYPYPQTTISWWLFVAFFTISSVFFTVSGQRPAAPTWVNLKSSSAWTAFPHFRRERRPMGFLVQYQSKDWYHNVPLAVMGGLWHLCLIGKPTAVQEGCHRGPRSDSGHLRGG